MRLVLGTRGSDLARTQTSMVKQALRGAHPQIEITTEIIRTSGDEGSQAGSLRDLGPQGRKGMFTAEIQRALLDRRIDVAVHSAKDLPSETTPELHVCAALPRAAVDDVLITKQPGGLNGLPPGATIATGSVRRGHQLHFARADLKLVDLRGNVPTRLRKLVQSPFDGIVLARAGLDRLGFDCARGELRFEDQALHVSLLPHDRFVPAGGQGIVALEIRADDGNARSLLSNINHAESLHSLRAEREFLRLLQGDCGTPVGVLATIKRGEMTMHAQIFPEAGSTPPQIGSIRASLDQQQPEAIAAALFGQIYGEENTSR
jgi:hydroxymethylbilane synthase